MFDAWQFMAGVLPATLRAVAAQRSNPLPADLSYSGGRANPIWAHPSDGMRPEGPPLWSCDVMRY
ncbi:hypothetical protein D3M56_02740 [Klebsiella pneumoniae]|nr:hypothetical protein [Klebsiella pneumoniae]